MNRPIDENIEICGRTWFGVLQHNSIDTWTAGARQYIAARLNEASGARVPFEAEEAVLPAEESSATCDFSAYGKFDMDAKITLDDYNNGDIGPGHCDLAYGTSLPEKDGLRSGERGEQGAVGCSTSMNQASAGLSALLLIAAAAFRRRRTA